MIIHFNGMAGVGKLTVASLLAESIGGRLLDNHLILDLVVAVVGARESDRYLPLIIELTNFVFAAIEKEADDVTFIMTNCLVNECSEDRARLDAIAAFAARRNHKFVQILLTCSDQENAIRLVAESRKSKGKLMRTDLLENYRKIYTMYHPETKHSLELDTTSLTASQAAARIASYVESL